METGGDLNQTTIYINVFAVYYYCWWYLLGYPFFVRRCRRTFIECFSSEQQTNCCALLKYIVMWLIYSHLPLSLAPRTLPISSHRDIPVTSTSSDFMSIQKICVCRMYAEKEMRHIPPSNRNKNIRKITRNRIILHNKYHIMTCIWRKPNNTNKKKLNLQPSNALK